VVALLRHAFQCRKLAGSGEIVIVLWPLLGWYDLMLLTNRGRGRMLVIVHDPRPLRPQVGLNERAGRLAARLGHRLPTVICHSSAATADATQAVRGLEVWTVPHPILRRDEVAQHKAERCGPTKNPVIGVFGQYKPARDLDLLERLAARWASDGWKGKIFGRGWPQIPGWEVQSRFLSEAELAQRVAEVDVALIPYRHYYQSGIAIRAVEAGTPIVGLANPFLEELLGSAYPGLVASDDDSGWVEGIRRTLAATTSAEDPSSQIAERWTDLLRDVTTSPES
jgi:hypothetical protein